jgi:predicted transposase YbfD/YdcC
MDVPEEIEARFPHVKQVARVIRIRTVIAWISGGKRKRRVRKTSHETVYLVTSLTAREVGPERIAAYTRNHWSIENKVHLVRDVTSREDSSKGRVANRSRNLATSVTCHRARPPVRPQRDRRHRPPGGTRSTGSRRVDDACASV